MAIGWNFPGNNNGQINGISESGIEIFKGVLIALLVRQVCQNSLYAALIGNDQPVHIEFEIMKYIHLAGCQGMIG